MIFADKELLVFLSCMLTKENPKYEWNPEKLDEAIQHSGDKYAKPKHSLLIKRAIVDAEAKDGELNLIVLQTKDVSGDDVSVPLAYLQAGKILQTSLDIPIHDTLVQFTLVKGTGPVHILATHTITAPSMDDEADDDEGDEEELLENGDSEDEIEPKVTNENGNAHADTDAGVPFSNDRKRKNDAELDASMKKIKTTLADQSENGKDQPKPNDLEGAEPIDVDPNEEK